MNGTVDNFKAELKNLLKKYAVEISFEADEYSDWHGITGEKMVISNSHGVEFGILSKSTDISHEEL